MRELLRGASSGFLTIRHRRCSHQLRNSPTIFCLRGSLAFSVWMRSTASRHPGKGRFTILPKFTA